MNWIVQLLKEELEINPDDIQLLDDKAVKDLALEVSRNAKVSRLLWVGARPADIEESVSLNDSFCIVEQLR